MLAIFAASPFFATVVFLLSIDGFKANIHFLVLMLQIGILGGLAFYLPALLTGWVYWLCRKRRGKSWLIGLFAAVFGGIISAVSSYVYFELFVAMGDTLKNIKGSALFFTLGFATTVVDILIVEYGWKKYPPHIEAA